MCVPGTQLAHRCGRPCRWVEQLKQAVLRYVLVNIHSTKNQPFLQFMSSLRPVDKNTHFVLPTDLSPAAFPLPEGCLCVVFPSLFSLIAFATSCHLRKKHFAHDCNSVTLGEAMSVHVSANVLGMEKQCAQQERTQTHRRRAVGWICLPRRKMLESAMT